MIDIDPHPVSPCTSPDGDAPRLTAAPGGYAWWYFDALSHDARSAMVAILYYGSVFSPRYLGRLAAGHAPQPVDYVAVSFQWYHGGQRAVWLFQEYGAPAWRYQESPFCVGVAGNTVRAESGGLRVTVDDATPLGHRVQGEWLFQPLGPGFAPAGGLDAHGRHVWRCPAPRCDVRGDLRLSVAGRVERTLPFQGTGYHDVNAGERPLWDDVNVWRWGRVHTNRETRVLYAPVDRGGRSTATLYRVGLDGAAAAEPCAANISTAGHTYLGLPRDASWTVSGTPEWTMTDLWENGPFYHRWRARHGPHWAIAETLYPQRLRRPWVRWMAACRAYRRGAWR